MDVTLSDLRDKGFAVLPNFLSPAECDLLIADYSKSEKNSMHNKNYNIKVASLQVMNEFEDKLSETADRIRCACGIDADITLGGMYFSTERGINFPWHQDHESYFIFNEHYHYLNFYIPIVKPDRCKTNLSLIPFDRLKEFAPKCYEQVVGRGATSLSSNGNKTTITFDEDDTELNFWFDLDGLAVTPELAAGDLLVLRGDVVHRTQDSVTDRVAVSFRRQSSTSLVSKDRLFSGGDRKKAFMLGNMAMYRLIFAYLDDRHVTQASAGELITFLREKWRP
jgi:hypothetical protein